MTSVYEIHTTDKLRVEPAPALLTPAEVDELRAQARAAAAAALEAQDDITIAYLVNERDAADTGERIDVDDLAREFGFDPSTLAE